MRAYYYDDLPGDQRLPHDSGVTVDAAMLAGIGVIAWRVDSIPDPAPDAKNSVDDVAYPRGYTTREVMTVTKEGLGDNYDMMIDRFFFEHMHEEEEIRCVLEGSGYLDFREHPTDRWIRVVVQPGDALILPTGIYHRFTLDDGNMIKAMLWHKDRSKWIPLRRGEASDANPYRIEYLQGIQVAANCAVV